MAAALEGSCHSLVKEDSREDSKLIQGSIEAMSLRTPLRILRKYCKRPREGKPPWDPMTFAGGRWQWHGLFQAGARSLSFAGPKGIWCTTEVPRKVPRNVTEPLKSVQRFAMLCISKQFCHAGSFVKATSVRFFYSAKVTTM